VVVVGEGSDTGEIGMQFINTKALTLGLYLVAVYGLG
jgi:hypothetical protein